MQLLKPGKLGSTLRQWLGPATEFMLEMAAVKTGGLVLDVAAGAGDQTLNAAKRVGPDGFVLATDIKNPGFRATECGFAEGWSAESQHGCPACLPWAILSRH